MAGKLNFKDPAESALVNGVFLGRDTDDATTGKIDLSNSDVASGDSITNIQRQLNENKTKLLDDQTVPSAGILLADNISKVQIKRVVGDAAAITVNALPFGSSPDIPDGAIIYVIGQDDTNTVTINHNDVDDGTLLNGNIELLKGYVLQLFWDANISRFIELGRNF